MSRRHPCTVRSKLHKFDQINVGGRGLCRGGARTGSCTVGAITRALCRERQGPVRDPLPPEQNDRHDFKHYLNVTSLVGGNDDHIPPQRRTTTIDNS